MYYFRSPSTFCIIWCTTWYQVSNGRTWKKIIIWWCSGLESYLRLVGNLIHKLNNWLSWINSCRFCYCTCCHIWWTKYCRIPLSISWNYPRCTIPASITRCTCRWWPDRYSGITFDNLGEIIGITHIPTEVITWLNSNIWCTIWQIHTMRHIGTNTTRFYRRSRYHIWWSQSSCITSTHSYEKWSKERSWTNE